MQGDSTTLALDLSVKETGWAIIGPSGRAHGLESFSGAESNPQVWLHFRGWLGYMIAAHRPAHIIVEKPVFRGSNSDVLIGLSVHARSMAYDRGIGVSELAPSTVKKQVAGTGKADKPAMIAAVRAHGWSPESDNDADAIALLIAAGVAP